jgi:hypothetical protein
MIRGHQRRLFHFAHQTLAPSPGSSQPRAVFLLFQHSAREYGAVTEPLPEVIQDSGHDPFSLRFSLATGPEQIKLGKAMPLHQRRDSHPQEANPHSSLSPKLL